MKIIQVLGDDWEGIYTNGKLALEGHSIGTLELLEWLKETGQKITSVAQVEADTEWLNENGSLPRLIEDVVIA